MEATENKARIAEHPTEAHGFVPAAVGRDFSAEFLDETVCRDWVLAKLHGRGERYCPGCRSPLTGIALLRFCQGKRLCCPACRKFFTARTGTFLNGCHFSYREVMLLALFLYVRLPRFWIASILPVTEETVRLWEIKFKIVGIMNGIPPERIGIQEDAYSPGMYREADFRSLLGKGTT